MAQSTSEKDQNAKPSKLDNGFTEIVKILANTPRSATTSLQNVARNVKAENRREKTQSSWVCQVYRHVNKYLK